MQGEAIMLIGKQFRDGLASVLTAQCNDVALKLHSLHHLRSIAKVHSSTGSVT